MDDDLIELINTLKQIQKSNRFPNFIDYIQFPFFRNIESDQRINFNFPLTAFIGPNGSGKSSTLHAIYGCPEGYTPYEFWFSTLLDPISYYSVDGRKLRHSFFYGYKNEDNEELQVIKARIQRAGNQDYWETSRPIISAGMQEIPERRRNPPIKKKVLYFDFRSELSAFDKYFYYETPPSYLISRTKQDYLRNKSKKMKNLFEGKYGRVRSHGVDQNTDVETLDNNELKIISNILGRNYSEIKIIYHKLYHNWGYSIRLKTDFHNYSEAFAGSGEMAVIRLVHGVSNTEAGSLILLDEPEVSLHPGAQIRLKYFILNEIKSHKHQIIISTHSPTLIKDLPKEAIKVFSQNLDTGKIIIKEDILPEEAFYFIGQEISDKINIVVEDKLSQKILNRILLKLGEEVSSRFVIKFIPGGATVIQQHIAVYSNTNIEKSFFVFDGDQKKVAELFDTATLSEANKTLDYLKRTIKEQTGVDIKFYPDYGVAGINQEQLIQMMILYLKYYKNHVFYLPLSQPEDIIWSEEVIRQKFSSTDYENNIERIRGLTATKDRIYESAKVIFGSDKHIDALEDIFIKEWIDKEDNNYQHITNIFYQIK
jgi:predicted ATPase